MKTCMKCGYVNPDDASFCVNCGENINSFVSGDNSYIPAGEGSELTADEAAVIDGMKRNLTREKKAFKIVSIIGIAVGSFFTVSLIFSLIIFAVVVAAAKPETTSNIAGLYMVYIIAMVYWFIMLTLVLLPISIVGLVAAKKINYYLESIDYNIKPTLKRASSVGMIVFSALFNVFAMIFVILNFTFVKRNAEAIERIIRKQNNKIIGL
ncbi:MAG: zinc-ribbon domain-containing protein [Clostridia bacterium]|nr:zinc-ribbon domain-containing protein [Clostridia bacterium]